MLDQVIAVDALLKDGHKPENIAMAGASAGGLVAGGALKMRDLGRRPVAALILWSPAGDLTMQGETVTTLRRYEPAFDVSKMDGMLDAVVPPANAKILMFNPFSAIFPRAIRDSDPGWHPRIVAQRLCSALSGRRQPGWRPKLDIVRAWFTPFRKSGRTCPESRLARRKDADFLGTTLNPELLRISLGASMRNSSATRWGSENRVARGFHPSSPSPLRSGKRQR